MQNALCVEKLTLHITLNTVISGWHMNVAALCCGDAVLQQQQGSWEDTYRNMELELHKISICVI